MAFKVLMIDVDGTAVDCEPRNRRVIEDIARDAGYEIQAEDWKVFAGTSHEYIWETLCDRSESFAATYSDARSFEIQCEKGYKDRISEIFANPAVQKIVDEFHKAGLPVIAISNSNHDHVEQSLSITGYNVSKLTDIFGKDDVKAAGHSPKPSPDPYIMGLERVNFDIGENEVKVTPEDCLILEDSKTGVRSALAFGATTLQITDYNDPVNDNEVEDITSSSGGKYYTSPTPTLYETYETLQYAA